MCACGGYERVKYEALPQMIQEEKHVQGQEKGRELVDFNINKISAR